MQQKNAIEQLIYLFSKLPGLGQRSSRRMVLHLLQDKNTRLQNLIDGLLHVSRTAVICELCGNIDSQSLCNICSSEARDNSTIAIVETVAELWAIERSSIYRGKYHVLGNSTSSSMRPTANDLRLPVLFKRCKNDNIRELIIATNATLDGQTTAYFITEYFKDCDITISRLASGIPVGGELDYLDEGTLSAAINLRQPFE